MSATGAVRNVEQSLIREAEHLAGGPARLQVIAVMAAVLGLDTADKATVSAVTGTLEQVFHVGNTEIGILIAVTSLAGAALTIPVGLLVDRMRRRSILLWAIGLWSVAMGVSGVASSYPFLLAARAVLGAVTAAAWPCVASLSGDFFPPRDRTETYGLILSGELIGIGAGFFIAGEVSSFLGWRVPFFLMAVLGAALVWAVWRFLPEPRRGGQSWISAGQEEVPDESSPPTEAAQSEARPGEAAARAQRSILGAGVKPRERLMLDQDPSGRSLWWAIRYLVRIPTYDLLVAASALAYFFFSGVRAFAFPYLTAHYGITRPILSALMIVLGVGGIGGVLFGGWISEWLLNRRWFTARIIVPGVCLLAAALTIGPAFWFTGVALGIGLLTAGTFALGAANPPIDAARLDIVHPRLWGRAESGRMVFRAGLEGIGPILFGYISDLLGGGQAGVRWTYMIMLAPLLLASSLTIPGVRTYPRDVATAAESVKRTARET